ncbi:hypothetical protein OC861_000498 [Tilletia horrida]|nr:hypothetical protein OC845_000359 [Tilletia horrida]KAK0569916.1 hypothetical protein OC861_000498 [Tilletia horrida]
MSPNLNITSGATVCQTTSSDATKTLQTCLEAVSGNSNNTVNCNFSGKASGGRKGATLVGSVALAGMVAMTVLATMA